jgi:hypothetical protein
LKHFRDAIFIYAEEENATAVGEVQTAAGEGVAEKPAAQEGSRAEEVCSIWAARKLFFYNTRDTHFVNVLDSAYVRVPLRLKACMTMYVCRHLDVAKSE